MIYVMSDIHGNKARFDSILEQINLQPEDTLYILGDVVDRYPDGIAIIQQIMKMPNVKMLLGNHEYMMMNALAKLRGDELPWTVEDWHDVFDLWFSNNGRVTARAIKVLTEDEYKELWEYLKSLPVNIDIEVHGQKYKLAHAASTDEFEPSGLRYDNEVEFAVWRRYRPGEYKPKDYMLICGHTPTINYQEVNPLEILYTDGMIDVDCGSGYPDDEHFRTRHFSGRLACLRLDDMKEFYSKEIFDLNMEEEMDEQQTISPGY